MPTPDDQSADENGAFFGIGQREQEVVQSTPTSNSQRVSHNQMELNIGEEWLATCLSNPQ